MNQIICRHVQDDFEALMTAQGMEDANCCVVSVTLNPTAPPMLRWIVWGRYDSDRTDPNKIDAAIQKRLFPVNSEEGNDG